MTGLRVVQISDLHLSRARPFFQFNFERVLERIQQNPPELVVVSGDMALNAIASPDDLDYARSQLERLPSPWLAIPGNHDVGNNRPDIRGEHVVTPASIAAYRRVFGPDHWAHEVGDWTFIGINALVLGSGLADEARQAAFLADALRRSGRRPIALFLHKPLFLRDPAETTLHQGSLYPEPRRALLDAIRDADVRLVSCGHCHELVEMRHDGRDIVWCPGTSFVFVKGFPDSRGGGERVPGYLELEVTDERISVTPVMPPELITMDIGGWLTGGIAVYDRHTGGRSPVAIST